MPGISVGRGLNVAGAQWSSIEEPFDSWIWVGSEADVDVDAATRAAAQYVVKSLVVL